MNKKNVFLLIMALVMIFVLYYFMTINENKENEKLSSSTGEQTDMVTFEESNAKEQKKEIPPYYFKVKNLDELRMNGAKIEDFYITNTGDGRNLYTIDDNGILWGCGSNQFGQLGLGNTDNEFHEKMVKIADDVIHVDYSPQKGYVIFLKSDHTLHGIGNNGTGALMKLDEFSDFTYTNGESFSIATPVLLMDNVKYARCGREDVIALKKDNSVWSWGIVWYQNGIFSFQNSPQKILEDVNLITGGPFNHAALKNDGTVWTWGYNLAGSCGVKNSNFVSFPQQVANDVKMIWTGLLYYNNDFKDIHAANEATNRALENTIIQKKDGSLWACGINMGTETKKISPYYESEEYETVCSASFYPCKIIEDTK